MAVFKSQLSPLGALNWNKLLKRLPRDRGFIMPIAILSEKRTHDISTDILFQSFQNSQIKKKSVRPKFSMCGKVPLDLGATAAPASVPPQESTFLSPGAPHGSFRAQWPGFDSLHCQREWQWKLDGRASLFPFPCLSGEASLLLRAPPPRSWGHPVSR